MRFVLFSLTPPLLEVIPHQETTAYLINDAGAKACLEVSVPLYWQIDTHMNDESLREGPRHGLDVQLSMAPSAPSCETSLHGTVVVREHWRQAVLCFRQPLSPTRPLPPGAVGDDGAVSETSPGVELELHHDDDDIWVTVPRGTAAAVAKSAGKPPRCRCGLHVATSRRRLGMDHRRQATLPAPTANGMLVLGDGAELPVQLAQQGYNPVISARWLSHGCSEASPDDFGALAGKVSDKSVVFRPTALCSIRSAMMQLVRDRKLPKERSYEEHRALWPNFGSETGSERPRPRLASASLADAAFARGGFVGEGPVVKPGLTDLMKFGACMRRTINDLDREEHWRTSRSPATRSPGSSRACQGSIHGGRSSENSTAAGSSLGPIVSSNFATGYPGEGETLQAHHPQDPRPSCHAGPALEYLRSTLRG
eukprot:g20469.t1